MMKKFFFFLALLLPIGVWANDVSTTTWSVTSTNDIPAGTKYELDDITLTIGEAGSNDFTVNDWGGPYDETFENLICGNGVNGDTEGGTFYLFKPKKNGNLTVFVSQNPVKKLFVEESGRVMDAFNGISHEEITEGRYKCTYTIPVYANLTYQLYCAGSKMGFYGFTFESRNDADKTYITFADEKVKALCVANWDTDHNGELSMTETAAVTTLGEVFKENKEITSFDELRFFTGLTSISRTAFGVCQNLTSVIIPDGVLTIEDGAFVSCKKLTSIIIPNSVTSIGFSVFERCSSLEAITIPNSVTFIDKYSFRFCGSLWSVKLSKNLTTLSQRLFSECLNLVSITIPEGVTTIEDGVFDQCDGFTSVNLPSSLTSIGKNAFGYCLGMTSLTIPSGVSTIGSKAFEYCNSLTSVIVENRIPIDIADDVFSNHANATLYVPVGCKAAYDAAANWQDFKKIVESGWAVTSTDDIPAGTKYELEDITLTIGEAGSNDFTVNEWGGPYDETFKNLICGNGVNGSMEGGTFYLFKPKKNGNLTVFVRQSVKNPKKFYVEEGGRVMEAFNGILPETTDDVYIGPYTIPVFANLTYKIYCAGSKMGFYGFNFEGRDDAEWTNIEFADEKVKALCVANWDTNKDGELSFAEAAAVTNINDVFNDNKEITSFDELRFFTGLKSLSFGALNECFELKSVCIPSGIVEMNGGAFASCHKLEYIGVDASNPKFKSYGANNAVIERAANRLVVGCPDAIIPDDITTIGKAAFWGHAGEWKDIPASVTKIDEGAFAYGGLNAVNISDNVEYIGESAFRCNSLWEVVIPAKVTYIGKDAFNECYDLGKVTVLNPNPIELSNAETFNNRANATLIVPSGSRAAYKAAEYWKEFKKIVEIEDAKVKLSKTKAAIEKGKTLTLKATVTPSDLADKSVTWKSSDTKVATVTSAGKVKGVKTGTATITCTSNSTGAKATCKVTVGSVKLDQTEMIVEKGKTKTLTATVYPSTLTDKSVTWESSDTKIATVTNAGKVKGVKTGTATITCTSNATGLSTTCEVTVGSVKLDQDEASVEKGKTVTLKATVYPTTLEDKTVTWTSSNTAVATVSSKGKVKGVRTGTATITCTSNATGLSATCEVTVGSVKLDQTEIVVEKTKTKTLTATVYPSTLTDKSVTWTSSNTAIATVSSKGKVKGVKTGTAIITCTSNATGLSATCEVTVGSVKLNLTGVTVNKGKTVTLQATVSPSTLEDKSVIWESSNTKVATVTSAGKVKGIKAGTAIITCTSVATGLSATCTVTVTSTLGSRSMEGDDDELTGIEENVVAAEPFDVYDLSGRKVRHQVTSLDGLSDGIYIVNGKKVLKKNNK